MSSEQLKRKESGLKMPVAMLDPPTGTDPCVCMLPDPVGRRQSEDRKPWSLKEKGLVIGLTLTIGVILGLLIIIFLTPRSAQTPQRQKSKPFCSDPKCVKVAGDVLSKADLTTDPCVDFYQYACGGWLDNVILPPDRPRFGVASQLVEHNQLRMKTLLESPDHLLYGKRSSAVRKAKAFYSACVLAEDLPGGAHNISQVIRNLGSWAVSRSSGLWDGSSWKLEEALFKANQHQVWPLFDRDVRQDMHNSQNMIITFSPPHLSAPDPVYYLGPPSRKFRTAFNELFSQVARKLGADNRTAYKEADKVWLFERRLAEVIAANSHDLNKFEQYRKLTLHQLQNITGNWINLSKYLSLVHEGIVPETEKTVIMNVDYMKKLADIIGNTSRSTLANYIAWRVVSSLIEHAGVDFRSPRLRFQQTMEGVSDLGATWHLCIERTTQVMGQATGAMFAEKYLSEVGKNRAADLLRTLKSAFLSSLPEVDWMVPLTREKAAAKLAAMVDRVGYGKVASSARALDKYYERMPITDNNAFQNWLDAVQFHFRRTRDKRGKPRDRSDWGYTSPTAVNAFYHQKDNAMMFPAGILRPPFFENSFPMGMNLGAIGTVMSHELTHGFDDQGRQYDKWGSLRDWWDNASSTAFTEKTKCFINQYSQYKVAGKQVNGHLTLSENLADSGGVRTAYRAYEQWLEKNGGREMEARLAGINSTERQTFFLAFAQLYCTYYTPEFAMRLLYTDPHAPTKYRVIGALSNFDKFSEAFNCKQNTPMNPTKKCTIW